MAELLSLEGNTRNSHIGAIRRSGYIPAVVYGHGIEPISISVESRAFAKLYAKAGYTTIVNLFVDGEKKEHSVFIKDIQFHPLKNMPVHIDFHQVRMDEVVRAKVPVEFVGESSAVKNLAGTLVKSIAEVEVEALPKDMPHALEIDITALADFDAVLHVSDIKVPAGVKLIDGAEEVVALVQPPRSEAELESLSEEVKEDVESVEGVKKEEPAEGEVPAAEGATEEKKGE